MHVPSQQLTQATGSCHALSTSADAHTPDISGLIKVSGEQSSRAVNVDMGGSPFPRPSPPEAHAGVKTPKRFESKPLH